MFKLTYPISTYLRSLPLFLLASFALGGCTTPEVCKDLGNCGGDVLGGQSSKTWYLAGACTNKEAEAPSVPSLVHQAPTLANEVPPKRTQVNWCSEMVLKPDKSIRSIQPWFPHPPLQSGNINYKDDGGFVANVNYFGPQEADFSAGCFLSQGFEVVPEGTATGPDTLTCSDFTPILLAGLSTQPNIMDFRCGSDGSGGCACLYNLLLVTGVEGKYTVEGSVIHHYDTTANNPVSSADYCVNGDTLELTGHRRTFLFNQPTLRSMVLTAGIATDAGSPDAGN